MAEIGIIASIIGVAGAGFRLSLVLNAIGCEVASAGIEIHSIAKQVSLFALMLKQIGQTFQAVDSIHSEEALQVAKEIRDSCQTVFGEIQEMLDKVQRQDRHGGIMQPSLQQRFKWCFKKGRVTYLLAQLESLKLSLVVMLQILNLGKLMASQTPSDPEQAAVKEELISGERAETQNWVIVRYWATARLDRLYDVAQKEALEEKQSEQAMLQQQPQLAIEAPPDENCMALIKLPPVESLADLDTSLNTIRNSPRDMVRTSNEVIDPLLARWTRWQDEQRRQASTSSNGPPPPRTYNAAAYEYYSSDDDTHNGDKEERGYFLEGTTTDWRQPHSQQARAEARQKRKEYKAYQPKVEDEKEPAGQHAKDPSRRASQRHIIDSSSDDSLSDSSDSEEESRRRREDRRKRERDEKSRRDHSRNHDHHSRTSSSQRSSRKYDDKYYSGSSSSEARDKLRHPSSKAPRPSATPLTIPGQHPHHLHHSVSSPIVHPSQSRNNLAPPPPYGAPGYSHAHPHSPSHSPTNSPRYVGPPPPGYPMYSPNQAYNGNGNYAPPPPGGYARSPSASGHIHSRKGERHDAETKAKDKARRHNNVKKSLLGAGALAGFMEALEGLSL